MRKVRAERGPHQPKGAINLCGGERRIGFGVLRPKKETENNC